MGGVPNVAVATEHHGKGGESRVPTDNAWLVVEMGFCRVAFGSERPSQSVGVPCLTER